jgi:hypothetical protein
LAIIEPYSRFQEFDWTTPQQSRTIRSLVCALTADCYRALDEVQTAAAWYRRAGETRKGGVDPALYADMVLSHGLADHYKTALQQLRDKETEWGSKPLLVRLYYNVISLWWVFPSAWELRLRERTFRPRLEELVND